MYFISQSQNAHFIVVGKAHQSKAAHLMVARKQAKRNIEVYHLSSLLITQLNPSPWGGATHIQDGSSSMMIPSVKSLWKQPTESQSVPCQSPRRL